MLDQEILPAIAVALETHRVTSACPDIARAGGICLSSLCGQKFQYSEFSLCIPTGISFSMDVRLRTGWARELGRELAVVHLLASRGGQGSGAALHRGPDSALPVQDLCSNLHRASLQA